MKHTDAFSALHPVLNLVFFLTALVWTVVLRHPVWAAISLLSGGCYYAALMGRKSLRTFGRLLVLMLALTMLNPLFNTQGSHPIFLLFGRPYTMEALCYGGVTACIFAGALLWFLCWEQVMTEDKLTALLHHRLPALSLLFGMVLRLVPAVRRCTERIADARRGIGFGSNASMRTRLMEGMTILSALTAYVLENSVAAADSMRARAYGTGPSAAYLTYRWKWQDILVLIIVLLFSFCTALCFFTGKMQAVFLPVLNIASFTSWSLIGLLCYALLLLTPTLLHIQEELKWLYWNSKI